MSTENPKHIPATLEMLRIGQVVELRTLHPSEDQLFYKWLPFKIDVVSDIVKIEAIINESSDSVRIPLLTHEDIVGLGAIQFPQATDWKIMKYKRYLLDDAIIKWYYDADIQNMSIKLYGQEIMFTILTPLDFRDLMRLLGIGC